MGVGQHIRLELGPCVGPPSEYEMTSKQSLVDTAIFSNSTSKGKGTGLKRRAEDELLDQVEVDLQQVDAFLRHVPVQRMLGPR